MAETIERKVKRLGYRVELRKPIVRALNYHSELFGPIAEVLLKSALGEKIKFLMEHYGIDPGKPDGLAFLALCLAQDWVPGCQIIDEEPRKRGAPQKITPLHLVQLYVDVVHILNERPAESMLWACTTFRKRNKTHPIWGQKDPRSLVNRCREGRQLFEQAANQAVKGEGDHFQQLDAIRLLLQVRRPKKSD
jgi:hypothetical protein